MDFRFLLFLDSGIRAMKSNKSYTKRFRVTKNGKILSRKPRQNHFLSKRSRDEKLALKTPQETVMSQRSRRRFLPRTKKKAA